MEKYGTARQATGDNKMRHMCFACWIRMVTRTLLVHFLFCYFQNVIAFHGTQVNLILFTLVRKVPPSLRRFSRNSDKRSAACAQISCFAFCADRTIYVKSTNKRSYKTKCKYVFKFVELYETCCH